MYKNLWTTTVVLTLALGAGACKKDAPDGTSNPPTSGDDGGGKGDDGGSSEGGEAESGGDDGAGSEGGAAEGGEDLTQTVCPAEAAETPTTYFGDSLLIRLPKGLTEDNLVERQPLFARAGAADSVSCVEGLPGATINNAIVGMFADDTARPPEELMKETVGAILGEEAAYTTEALEVKGRKLSVIINIPASDQGPEGKVWFAMKSGKGFMAYAYFEVHPNAWNAVKETFKASTSRMLIAAEPFVE